jgi:hypothetical protein
VGKLYAAAVKRAAALVGGEGNLARVLATRPGVLARWIEGREVPPLQVFLKAVDLITEHEVSELVGPPRR